MKPNRSNAGFTLVELLITIVAGSIITAAATTVLLLGFRINFASNSASSQQNAVGMGLTMLKDLAAEQCKDAMGDSTEWKVKNKDGDVLFSYKNQIIYLGTETPLINNVEESTANLDEEKSILTITVKTTDGKEYETEVYCRVAADPTEAAGAPGEGSSEAGEFASAQTLRSATFESRARQAFLDTLAAEEGSTGCSLTTGEYYSEWYIGSYEANPAWNEDTPWCACFISWALNRCDAYLKEVPRYAHVDKFMESFDEDHWKTENPEAGDVVFFDWIVNDETKPQHVGVVVTVQDGYVYTIEGNSNGKVASCRYAMDDPCILGYGELKWK